MVIKLFVYFSCIHSYGISIYFFQTKEERYAIMDCHCDNDDFHQDVTPIVLAAQRNDFTIVKVMHNTKSYGMI